MAVDRDALSSCPFCSYSHLSVRQDREAYVGGYNWIVLCQCGACGPNTRTASDARLAWNRRSGSPAPAEPVVWTDAQVKRALNAYSRLLDGWETAHVAMRAALEAASRDGA